MSAHVTAALAFPRLAGPLAIACGLLGCREAGTSHADVRVTQAPLPHEETPSAPAAPCVPDECSLATIRAMVTTELQLALRGQARAQDGAVKAVADRIVNDVREDEATLNALEAQLAVTEVACPESQKTAATLAANLPASEGDFDRTFVRSQLAALGEMKRIVNGELIGCAANGNLKTALRSIRLRRTDRGDAGGGVVADLAALQGLVDAEVRAETPPPLPVASGPGFVHPGILVTPAQLDFVKKNIARGAEPWSSAFRRAKADSHGTLAYTPHPPLRRAATDTAPAAEDGVVLCGSFSDPDVHCADEKEDAVAAYTQALLWYLSGDERYARNAVAILDAWATLEDHRLFNAALQAGWTGTMFARAAELMQLWPPWPSADVGRFKAMMRRAFLPRLFAAQPGMAARGDASYGQNGNWVLSVADSLIQIGVLLDDHYTFDRGVALWRDRVPAYCYSAARDGAHPRLPAGGYGGPNAGYASPATRTGDPYGYWGQAGGVPSHAPAFLAGAGDKRARSLEPAGTGRVLLDGTSQETCRDLEHVQFGLAALINGAETARIQGVDLYREEAGRIASCMELAALYENESPTDASGHPLAYATPVTPAVAVPAREATLCPDLQGHAGVTLLNTGSLGTATVQPTWEVGYNALANRLGLSLPLTRALITRYRSPAAGWIGATHHMGWETLTHADVGSVGLPALTATR